MQPLQPYPSQVNTRIIKELTQVNKKPKNIEQLFSESFNDFRIEPSSGLWKSISSKLAWKSFFLFNPTTLNAYYLSAILAVATAGVLLISKPVIDNSQEIKEISISKAIETPTIITVQENKTEPKEVTTQEDLSAEAFLTAEASAKAVAKAESRKLEAGSRKQETDSKIKVKIEDQRSNKDIKSIPEKQKLPSSAIVTTKTENQELVPSTQKPATSNQQPVTRKQKTDSSINDHSNQQPAASSVVLTKEDNQQLSPFALFEIYPSNPVLPTDPVSFINLSKNAVRYEWSFGDSESSDEFEPVHFYNRANNYNIKLKVWSEDGSVDSLVICYNFANSAFMIEFPNAFTPNSNGPTNGYYTPGLPNNDVFHPTYKSVVEYHLSIFNRRGELIFECYDINVGWDGYINDRLATQGVYIWKARGRYTNGENFIKAGNVILIKK